MAYRTVAEVIKAYTERYTISRSIRRCQQARSTSTTDSVFNFWIDVECELLKLKLQEDTNKLNTLKK